MEDYTFLAITKDKELFLVNLAPIEFTENIYEALRFESEISAKSKLNCRFLSLSNWISTKEDVEGIYLVTLKNDKIQRKERFL